MADAKGPAADSADAEEPTPKGWPMFTFFGSGPPYVNQDANVTTPEETAVNIQVLMNAEDSDLFVQEIVTAMYSGMATTYSDAPVSELYCTTPTRSCRSSTTPTRRCRSSTARTGPRRSSTPTLMTFLPVVDGRVCHQMLRFGHGNRRGGRVAAALMAAPKGSL